MKEFYENNKKVILPAIIFIAVFLLFSQILNNDFVYDDRFRIVANQTIKTTINPVYYFTHPDAGRPLDGIEPDVYRPLSLWLLSLEYKIFGLDPFYYHLINLLLHSANAVLFFLLLKKIFGSEITALSGAFLFGAHPVTTESVAWAIQQNNLWSWFFAFLTLIFAIRASTTEPNYTPQKHSHILENMRMFFDSICEYKKLFTKNRLKLFLLVLLSFASIFSKEQAIILPAIFLLITWADRLKMSLRRSEATEAISNISLNKEIASLPAVARPVRNRVSNGASNDEKKVFRRSVLAVTLSAVLYIAFRFLFLGTFTQQEPWGGGRYSVFLTMINGVAYYFKLLVWPYPLSINYDSFPIIKSLNNPELFISLIILSSIITATVLLWKKLPIFSLGIAWIFIVLAPVSNFIFPMKQILDERFIYFALPGFIISLLAIVKYFNCEWFLHPLQHSNILQNVRMFFEKRLNYVFKTIPIIAIVLILSVFSTLTFMRLSDWKSELALWRHEIEIKPNSWRTQKNYAWALEAENQTKESIEYYKNSLKLAHNSDLALKSVNALAIAYIRADEPLKTVELLLAALKDFPDQNGLLYTLGQAYLKDKQYNEAEKIFSNLSEKNKGEDTALFFAVLSQKLGGKKDEEVKNNIAKIKNLRFREQTLLLIQGREKMLEKKWRESISLLVSALKIAQPPILETYLWLAESFEKSGEKEKALAVYDLMLSINPLSIDAMQRIKRLEQ